VFLEQLKIHNRDWKKISAAIPTRTIVQIRTHAQKFFLASERPFAKKKKLDSSHDQLPRLVTASNPGSTASSPVKSSKRTQQAPDSPLQQPATLFAMDSPVPRLLVPAATMQLRAAPLVWLDEWRHDNSPTSVDELLDSKLWGGVAAAETIACCCGEDDPTVVERMPPIAALLSQWIDEI
jgi:hypothetical protein